MKKLILLLATLLLLPFVNATCIYYFYGSGCPHCANVAQFLDEIALRDGIKVQKFETWSNQENNILFDEMAAKYGLTSKGVPALFIGDEYLLGDSPIINNLESLIVKYDGAACPGEAVSSEPVVQEQNFSPVSLVVLIALAVFIVYAISNKKRNN